MSWLERTARPAYPVYSLQGIAAERQSVSSRLPWAMEPSPDWLPAAGWMSTSLD